MSMGMGFDESYARRNSPEGRAELEAIHATRREEQHQALVSELKRFGGDALLPGGAEAIAKQNPELGFGDAATRATRATRVFEYLQSPAADRYRKPETVPAREQPTLDFDTSGPPIVRQAPAPKPAAPRQDALRTILNTYKGEFKTPALMEKFYDEHALDYAHADPAAAIRLVVGVLNDRKSRAYQKHEVAPDEATLRLVEALRPFDDQLAGRLIDVAEDDTFADLVGPNAPRDVKHLEHFVVARLSNPSAAPLLRDGTFDPSLAVRPRPAAVQQQQPAAPAFPDLMH